MNFDLLEDVHVFVILFEASNPIIDSRYKFHRGIIEQTELRDLNPFCSTVVQYSTLGTFRKNYLAAWRAGMCRFTFMPFITRGVSPTT